MDSSYQYTTTYSSGSGTDAAMTGAAIAMFIVLYFIFIIAIYVVTAFFLGKLFKKASVPAWVAWVPVYNTWKLLQIGGQQGWWAILAFVPVANIASLIFTYIAMFHIGRKLGKSDAFILLGIFLSIIWIIWLGADSSTWDESKGAPRTDTPTLPVTPPAAATPIDSPTTAVLPQQPTPDPVNDQNQVPPAAPTL